MTVSIGAATDYLYAKAQDATFGVLVNGDPILVVDGWPDEVAFGMFVVGLSSPPPDGSGETVGTRAWAALGGQRTQEDYTIPCYIDVRVAGKTQKTARDINETIFNSFWALLAADLTLGGALKGGRYAEITDVNCLPGNLGTVGEPGRRQLTTFGVHCRNLTS